MKWKAFVIHIVRMGKIGGLSMIFRKKSRGFTLIELLIVLVILAILAVTAMPSYIDITADAKTAAQNGITGALAAAASSNYAIRKANSAKGVPITNCTDVVDALQEGALPSGYTITAAAIAADAVVTCSLVGPSGTTTFKAIGIA